MTTELKTLFKAKFDLAKDSLFMSAFNYMAKALEGVEAMLVFHEGKVEMAAAERVGNVMIFFNYKTTDFLEYEFHTEGEGICISVEELQKVFGRFKDGIVTILNTSDNRITISNESSTGKKKSFDVWNFDQSYRPLDKRPNLPYEGHIKVKMADIFDACEDIMAVDKSKDPQEGSLHIQKEGDDMTVFKDFDGKRVKNEFDFIEAEHEDASVILSMKYMLWVAMKKPFMEEATLQYQTNMPIKIRFEDDKLDLLYIIGHRDPM